ncbi:MAG TPA: ribonuclease III [Bacteroidia bacterium]|nr:ribonuclease III [Bacteroidia bacterium]HRS60028.1 ribonuclease III [Bacteroidia bacterium]HRU68943.1 ribonuclease III [Bacteroidia bacterium]
MALFLKKQLRISTKRIDLYEEALTHKSYKPKSRHNEKLEFLGDSIISAIISHYLLILFPKKSEGELSVIRSNIVRRETLNKIAKNIGIDKVLKCNPGLQHEIEGESRLLGNALEALIGAIYLDKGYQKTYKIVLSHLIWPYIIENELAEEEKNFKGRLLELSQQKNMDILFETNEVMKKGVKYFNSIVLVNSAEYGRGVAVKKKEAEQRAAEEAYKKLLLG